MSHTSFKIALGFFLGALFGGFLTAEWLLESGPPADLPADPGRVRTLTPDPLPDSELEGKAQPTTPVSGKAAPVDSESPDLEVPASATRSSRVGQEGVSLRERLSICPCPKDVLSGLSARVDELPEAERGAYDGFLAALMNQASRRDSSLRDPAREHSNPEGKLCEQMFGLSRPEHVGPAFEKLLRELELRPGEEEARSTATLVTRLCRSYQEEKEWLEQQYRSQHGDRWHEDAEVRRAAWQDRLEIASGIYFDLLDGLEVSLSQENFEEILRLFAALNLLLDRPR